LDKPFPAYSGTDPYVFVSYAHKDSADIYPELIRLNSQGFNIWYDEGISPGSEWSNELAKAIQNASVFLFFGTPNSSSSDNCIDEISFALGHSIPYLGVYLTETQMPAGMQMRLDRHQAILKYEMTEVLYQEKLTKGLSKLLKLERILVDENLVVPSKGKPAIARWKKVAAGLVLVIVAFGTLLSIDQSRLWLIEVGFITAIKVAGIISPVELEQELGIAVLPFVNMSNDPDNEYFSDGISEQILNALVKANRMNVIARTSSFSYKGKNQNIKEIGRRLGVTHILEGSVRKADNKVRITVQLIDATTGAHLWSENYDRELLDIFSIQDEIAMIVTDQIDQTLGIVRNTVLPKLATRGTQSTAAFDLFLQAQQLANIDNPYEMQKAIPLYRQAIAADGKYADAWAGLAGVYVALSGVMHHTLLPSEALPLAIDAARNALALEPNHDSAMGLLGWAQMNLEFKWKEGSALLEKSIALNPLGAKNLAIYGYFLMVTRQKNAESVLEKAYRLNPLGKTAIVARSVEMFEAGQPLNALSLLETLLIDDREGYSANFLIALFANRANIQNTFEESYNKLREMVGPKHSTVRFFDRLIALEQSKMDEAEQIRRELLGLLRQNHYVLYPLQLASNDKERTEIFNIIYEQRTMDLMSLFGQKPSHVSIEDWERIRKLTHVSDINTGSADYYETSFNKKSANN